MRRERTVPESVTAMVGAERVVRRRETVVHLMEDWDLFVRTLVNPPQPNRMLKAAKVASTRLRPLIVHARKGAESYIVRIGRGSRFESTDVPEMVRFRRSG